MMYKNILKYRQENKWKWGKNEIILIRLNEGKNIYTKDKINEKETRK